MIALAKDMEQQEDKLVQLYQDIMDCDEEHARAVYIVLSEIAQDLRQSASAD